MTIEALEEKLAQYCVAEMVVQEGNLVTLKLGIGLTSGDYPFVQGTGNGLEMALRDAFEQAEVLCAKMERV